MADTFCSSDDVALKAGANAATLTAGQYTTLINQAESFINVAAKFDFLVNFALLKPSVNLFLEGLASSLAARATISYDMSGFTSRAEAQTMLDVNQVIIDEGLKMLTKDKDTINWINNQLV